MLDATTTAQLPLDNQVDMTVWSILISTPPTIGLRLALCRILLCDIRDAFTRRGRDVTKAFSFFRHLFFVFRLGHDIVHWLPLSFFPTISCLGKISSCSGDEPEKYFVNPYRQPQKYFEPMANAL